MTVRILVDTNVLVYAYSLQEPQKQKQAQEVLTRLVRNSAGALSTQVLAEFTNVALRKLANPLTAAQAYKQVELLLRSWTVLDVTGPVVLEALRGVRDYQLSFWDAEIWAIARLNQLPLIFSEDFNDSSTLEGVTFINPFTAKFDITNYGVS